MPKIADLEALELIVRLPDDTPLTTSEAAVFLRVSKSTLDKMRRPDARNEGPIYSQGGGLSAEGSNQKVIYFKRDLKSWLEGNRVSNTLEAAVRRGQMFRTLPDILEPVAFWLNPDDEIVGLVDETDVDMFFERLGKWKIEWLPPSEASSGRWESVLEHKTFAAIVSEVLSTEKSKIAAAVEASEIAPPKTDKPGEGGKGGI